MREEKEKKKATEERGSFSLNILNMKDNKLKKDVSSILTTALKAVAPHTIINNAITLSNDMLCINGHEYDLPKYEHIYVIGGGKASGGMAQAIEEHLKDHISKGYVNVLQDTKNQFQTEKIELQEGSHPLPDEMGHSGTKEILKLAHEAGENDLILFLISGGGSALLCAPAEGISLREMKKTTKIMMNAGAPIDELNTVRKHLSRIKGGLLAKEAFPATVVTLLISDVIGDPLDAIASGPTAPDPSTYQEAKRVLEHYDLWKVIPSAVIDRLRKGIKGEIPETLKEGDNIFQRVTNIILANNRRALKAAKKQASFLGYKTKLVSGYIEGEAREVGKVLGAIAVEEKKHHSNSERSLILLAGGETTVTVEGHGRGGSNQELALGAALKIKDEADILLASLATDGIDGNSPAAGAVVDGKTIKKARGRHQDPISYLENNDSYGFFKEIGGLIRTGPTGTNVNDLICILVNKEEKI